MSSIRLTTLLFVFLLASSLSHGQEFRVGESVIVTKRTDVMTKQKRLGTVARGTEFDIRQSSSHWLLGQFDIGSRKVLGWVATDAVRRENSEASELLTYDFSWENLLLAKVKLDKYFDFDAHVDDYLKAFRPAVWQRFRNDEFQLAAKRAEALRIFRQRVDEFDLNRELLVRATVSFGTYDFAQSAFPINEATENWYWYEQRYTNSGFPGRLKVFFKNPELIKYLPMPPAAAERFIASRKDRGGRINRRIVADIRIRLSSMKSEGNELWSEIRWAQFFGDNNRTRLLYETPKPPTAEFLEAETPTFDERTASVEIGVPVDVEP